MSDPALISGDDGHARCWWCGTDPLYTAYHDQEWGVPVLDDQRLFEKICLEGFQAGLSWLTILRKREAFREAFDEFDFQRVARFRAPRIERLVLNAGIVRHRGKIESTVNNAQRALDLADEFGSLAAYFWQFRPTDSTPATCREEVPSQTDASRQLSRDLKKKGWSFVGPTTCYAFMQAMGMVNDHLVDCHVHRRVARLKRPVV